MTEWSLSMLLGGLHEDVQPSSQRHAKPSSIHDQRRCQRKCMAGNAETVFAAALSSHKGHVVDSKGKFSDQIDVLIFRPPVFAFHLSISGTNYYSRRERLRHVRSQAEHQRWKVRYAHKKSQACACYIAQASPFHCDGTMPAKPLHHIIGGLFTFESDWDPPLGKPLLDALPAKKKLGGSIWGVWRRMELSCAIRKDATSPRS